MIESRTITRNGYVVRTAKVDLETALADETHDLSVAVKDGSGDVILITIEGVVCEECRGVAYPHAPLCEECIGRMEAEETGR